MNLHNLEFVCFITDCLDGEILLNGKEVNQELMSNISGYVCQKDLILENLTVKEHLTFTVN